MSSYARKNGTKKSRPKRRRGLRFLHIVLTGGPQAGKTTLLNLMRARYGSSRKVIIVPESATYVFERGFPLPGRDKVAESWAVDISQILLPLTAGLAMIVTEADAGQDGTVIVIHDRGMADTAAYRSHFCGGSVEDFYTEQGLTEEAVYAKYDLVICLASMAEMRPKQFGKKGNAMRHETPSQAAAVSKAIQDAWSRHARYHFIKVYGQSRLAEAVFAVTDQAITEFENQPRDERRQRVEIEKKYVLPVSAGHFFLFGDEVRSVPIRQGYVVAEDDVEVRVREVSHHTLLTVKVGAGLKRLEIEFHIPREMFDALWKVAGERVVTKTRFYHPLPGGKTAEVDVYSGADQGLVTVEVEFWTTKEARKFKGLPTDIHPIFEGAREVTGDEYYSNRNLANRKKTA